MSNKVSVLSKDGKKLFITIDKNECIGAASCMVISPNTFGIDDESKAYIVSDSVDDLEHIIESAKSCPTGAITIKDEDGNILWPGT
ncbi:ferredoxin [Patescibacteria group bacterium]|nr:ferredoxin [Patescibacteria group bacterium]